MSGFSSAAFGLTVWTGLIVLLYYYYWHITRGVRKMPRDEQREFMRQMGFWKFAVINTLLFGNSMALIMLAPKILDHAISWSRFQILYEIFLFGGFLFAIFMWLFSAGIGKAAGSSGELKKASTGKETVKEEKKKRRGVAKMLGLILLALFSLGLILSFDYKNVKEPPVSGGKEFTLTGPIQVIYGDLSVGNMGIGVEDYTGEDGRKIRTAVAGLAFDVAGDPSLAQQGVAIAGKSFRVGKYYIFIEEVRKSLLGKGQVRFRVWENLDGSALSQ